MARKSLILLALCLAGCGTTVPPTVYVGHVAPLRGADQAVGQSAQQGIRLAVMGWNAAPEKGPGYPVTVLHANAPATDSFRGEGLRLRHINQAGALIGGRSAAEVLALDQSGLPILSPAG